jgi:hypothetical protein
MNNVHNLYLYKVILTEGCYLMDFMQDRSCYRLAMVEWNGRKYGILLANMKRSQDQRCQADYAGT